MRKNILLLVIGATLLSRSSFSQSLNEICMDKALDSAVQSMGMSDSITIAGNCDSAVALRQVGPIKMPVATLVKKDSCLISLSIIGLLDTIYNYCQLPVVSNITSFERKNRSLSIKMRQLVIGN